MGSCASVSPLAKPSNLYDLDAKETPKKSSSVSEVTTVRSFVSQKSVEIQVDLLKNVPSLQTSLQGDPRESNLLSAGKTKIEMNLEIPSLKIGNINKPDSLEKKPLRRMCLSSRAALSSKPSPKVEQNSNSLSQIDTVGEILNDNSQLDRSIEPSLSSLSLITKRSFNSLHSPSEDDYSISPSNDISPSTDSMFDSYDATSTQRREGHFLQEPRRAALSQSLNALDESSPLTSSSIEEAASLVKNAPKSATLPYVKVKPTMDSSISTPRDESRKNAKKMSASAPHVKMQSTIESSILSDGKKMVNEYIFLRTIGRGSYGKVKLVQHSETGLLYAMKICSRTVLKRLRRDERGRPIRSTEVDDLMKEVAILKKVEHPNVVKLYEVIDDANCDKVYMVFEYVDGGAVLDQSSNHDFQGFPEREAKKYFRDLLKGLQYLHDHKIIHRDIKPENLLVDKYGTLKLTDFGVSIMYGGDDDMVNTSAGTPSFLPPEACQSGTYRGKPFDIWCCGVTLFVLLYGHVPFQGTGIMGTYASIRFSEPTYPETISPSLKDLFNRLLEKDPNRRITLKELLVHPWVTDEGTNLIQNDYVSPQEVSKDDIENAIISGVTTRLIDRLVCVSRVQSKFVRRLQNVREKLEKNRLVQEVGSESGTPTSASTSLSNLSTPSSSLTQVPIGDFPVNEIGNSTGIGDSQPSENPTSPAVNITAAPNSSIPGVEIKEEVLLSVPGQSLPSLPSPAV